MKQEQNKNVFIRLLNVFRRKKKASEYRVRRMFDEIFEISDNREFPCPICLTGEMKHISTTPSYNEGRENYECNSCGHTETYP